MNKPFNKNLIMSKEEEHLFQKSNSCWICKKLIDNDEEKLRHHCHVTGKLRGVAHWDCSCNLSKFERLQQSFNFYELDKFDVKICIIPNGLEKCMGFSLIET